MFAFKKKIYRSDFLTLQEISSKHDYEARQQKNLKRLTAIYFKRRIIKIHPIFYGGGGETYLDNVENQYILVF